MVKDKRHWPRHSRAVASWSCFFFQAEDGIRDYKVTGVQTCALPISLDRPHLLVADCAYSGRARASRLPVDQYGASAALPLAAAIFCAGELQIISQKIGRASCRERV